MKTNFAKMSCVIFSARTLRSLPTYLGIDFHIYLIRTSAWQRKERAYVEKIYTSS